MAFVSLAVMVSRADVEIKFVTSADVGSELTFYVTSLTTGFTIDWGGGVVDTMSSTGTTAEVNGTVVGDTIVLACEDDIYSLDCSGCQLTDIDLTQPGGLLALVCSDNELTSLYALYATSLRDLDCSGNQLTELSVSSLSNLRTLNCSDNQLTELDLSGCRQLEVLIYEDNAIGDVSLHSSAYLRGLWCDNNGKETISISGEDSLRSFSCSDNQLTEVDAADLTAVEDFWCNNNQLDTLDLSSCTALNTLSCAGNGMKKLSIGGISSESPAYYVDCSNNALTLSSLYPTKYVENYLYSPQDTIQLDFTEVEVKTAIDFSDLLCNASGTSVGSIAFYNSETDEELSSGVSSSKDYYASSGSVRFWETSAGMDVYAKITSSQYTDLEFVTSSFYVNYPEGISPIEVEMDEESSDIIYNLQGQRVDNPLPGIYIKDGKKIIIK